MALDASLQPNGGGTSSTSAVLRAPSVFGVRSALLAALALAGIWSYVVLDLEPSDLAPGPGGLALAGEFFSRALSPALRSEAQFVPAGTPPLLVNALDAALTTLLYATAAMGLALALGVFLGFFASTAWWAGDPTGGQTALRRIWRRSLAPASYLAVRALIAVMRSIHELLWAVLFLAALGLNELAAILAIAIPYAGTLAKVFSEMVDEAPRNGAAALRGAGASRLQVYFFALIPRALPDMTAYAFYRLECALRSSAILGFFGFPTLGLYIRQSFNSTNYGEVWTYLYVLMVLVVIFDTWSGAMRRRAMT
jgi:phosphonate transport system permease protein